MSLKQSIKDTVINTFDTLYHLHARYIETIKFQDKRRVAIYSHIKLTKEQTEQIDLLYSGNYGEKIPYTWHRHYTAFTGKFDVNYFPELLYIPEFEHFMNMNRSYSKVLADKNLLPLFAKAISIDTPHVFLSATQGIFRNSNYEQITKVDALKLLNNLGEVFCKPSVDTSSGVGCMIANFKNGRDEITGSTVEKLLDVLGRNFLIQEKLHCHPSIESIYPGSVNTFRVITYRWNDQIRFFPIIMRIGQGGAFLDNAHAGGMFIAIEQSGEFHRQAFTEFNVSFEKHPDTGVVFEHYKIPLIKTVIASARRMHMALPDIGVVNWDYTIGFNGNPILIEANLTSGSVWLSEMAHGCGPFGDKTAEILRWLRLMKRIPANERNYYAFGNKFE